MTISVRLSDGELTNVHDGHYYNEHVLEWSKVESVAQSSDMVEMEVSCSRCGEYRQERVHTNSEPHIWAIHQYLVGQFDEKCSRPQRKIQRAAKRVYQRHIGQVVDDDLLSQMKDEIRNEVGRDSLKVVFV